MPGQWHNRMENYFPKHMREIKFFTTSMYTEPGDKISRRADVRLSYDRVLEIQHSHISKNEIEDRFNDYKEFGKEIIWFVDGNTGIDYEQLSNGNYLLIFRDNWKYKSFQNKYNYFLLDINDKIFKIEVNKVKSKMIELKEFKSMENVIDILKNDPKNIWEKWKDDNVIKSKLTIHQKGAGNGKTYGIWKSIAENTDKKTYIIITKQHSAKTVIRQELDDQAQRDEYHIVNLEDRMNVHTKKHYVVKYRHKISKRECIVIIGTIDSFIYNLASKESHSDNVFESMRLNLSKYGPDKIHRESGSMKFGGQNIYLNKQCEIWIDEAQDLDETYLHASTRLMLDTGVEIQVVGDKLQSLSYENNFLTLLEADNGLPNIDLLVKTPENNNRRIKVLNYHEHINKLLNFQKYKLPPIKLADNVEHFDNNEENFVVFDAPAIHAGDKNTPKLNNFVNDIIKMVDNEVNKNSYVPQDFMFIFPIMKGNIVASELFTKLQTYWINKFSNIEYRNAIKKDKKDDNKVYWGEHDHKNYTQYVFLHKHTEGSAINTDDSKHGTRIMSIQTSKGDGRKIVFMLDATEKSLKKVSNNKIGLCYESYLHVGTTRNKIKTYFGLVKNTDDIHRRFSNSGYCEYLSKLSSNIKLNSIIDSIDKKNLIFMMEQKGVLPYIDDSSKTIQSKEQVDWGYHCIKYQTYIFRLINCIISNKDNNTDYDSGQLAEVIKSLANMKTIILTSSEYYTYLNNYSDPLDNISEFPVCILSYEDEYVIYVKSIKNSMKKVQKCIINNTLDTLSVFESIILTYMIDVYKNKKYANITPVEIYNIYDFFKNHNNKEAELLKQTGNIDNILKKVLTCENTNIKWTIHKSIIYNGNNKDFKISKRDFVLIGDSSSHITHIKVISDISQLNYWDYLIEVLLERFLIYNAKPNTDSDYHQKQFKSKPITTYIVVVDKNDYIKIDWKWDKDLNNELLNQVKLSMLEIFKNFTVEIFNYLKFIKDGSNNGNLWGKGTKFQTPFNYISEKIKSDKYPMYIVNFFEDMHEKWVNNRKDDVKPIYQSLENFSKQINTKLEIAVDNYLGLCSKEVDDDF